MAKATAAKPEFSDNAEDQTPDVVVNDDVMETPPDDADDFEYVRLPNGQVRAVPKSAIVDAQERPATAKQDASATAVPVQEPAEFYVHLSNGDVVRVAEEDLPGHAGADNPFGYWQRDGNLYHVIGVYPVETTVKGNGQ